MEQEQLLLNLPKIELHLHLEGGIRYSTVVELSQKQSGDIPPEVLQLDHPEKY